MLPHPEIDDERSQSSIRPSGRSHVGVRALSAEDLLLVARWLGSPEIVRLFGPARESIAFLRSPPSRSGQYLIQIEQSPVGYLRYFPLSDQVRQTSGLGTELWSTTVELELFIADRELRCLGIGSAALEQVRGLLELAREAKLVGRCSAGDFATRRAFEKAGFLRHVFYQDPSLGAAVIML